MSCSCSLTTCSPSCHPRSGSVVKSSNVSIDPCGGRSGTSCCVAFWGAWQLHVIEAPTVPSAVTHAHAIARAAMRRHFILMESTSTAADVQLNSSANPKLYLLIDCAKVKPEL
jgi:hypothetical protein